MAGVLSNLGWREAGIAYVTPILHITSIPWFDWVSSSFSAQQRVEYYFTTGVIFRQVFRCFSSIGTTVPAFIFSIMSHILSYLREEALFFLFFFIRSYPLSFILSSTKDQDVERKHHGGGGKCTFLPFFAGYIDCFEFVSEERNEVCTDNVSVLRNRVFI